MNYKDRNLKSSKLTPMQRQWLEIKKQYPDYIIFWRLGDFYETFNDDALVTSKALNIVLTSRKTADSSWPLAGVPHHAIDSYLAKMVEQGYKVAIVEQLEDPKTAKTIVKRGVVRLVSKGTVLETQALGTSNNYLISIVKENDLYGLAAVDLTAGEFLVGNFSSLTDLNIEVARLNPTEIIVEQEFWKKLTLNFDTSHSVITYKPDYFFDIEQGNKDLCDFFGVLSLEGFGVEENTPAIGAASAVISYLKETQFRDKFPNITKISPLKTSNYMIIDPTTMRSLELVTNITNRTESGTLRNILDNTKTTAGSRLLTQWILRPLYDMDLINERLDSVSAFVDDIIKREDVRSYLSDVSDIQRINGRICLGKAKPRELIALKETLMLIPDIKQTINNLDTKLVKKIHSELNPLANLVKLIDESISEDAPNVLTEGGVIKKGYNQELDELRAIKMGGKDYLASLEIREREKTGIKNLKVKFNKVFGYFIEVSKSYTKLVPDYYDRKQTLVNAERYITPELKEYEEKILSAEEKISVLEERLYNEILSKISSFSVKIQNNAYYLAVLDVITTFAYNAVYNNYSRPEITHESVCIIEDGRHPVVEQLLKDNSFIPNNCTLNEGDSRILVITGPNMGGKCVTADTLIFSAEGILPISNFMPAEIKPGEFKEISLELIGKEGIENATHFYYDGLRNTIKIITKNGYSIEGTYNHPILVKTKEAKEEWKVLSEVSNTDKIIINRDNDLWGTKTAIAYKMNTHLNKNTSAISFPSELSEDLAYLVGLLLGKGKLSHDFYCLSGLDITMRDLFNKISTKLFNTNNNQDINYEKCCIKSPQIIEFIKHLGLNSVLEKEKAIPRLFLIAPKDILLSLIQGIFDSSAIIDDRSRTIKFSTVSFQLAKQIHIILLNAGVVSKLRIKRTIFNKYYEISIRDSDITLFYKQIGSRKPNLTAKMDDYLRAEDSEHEYITKINVPKYFYDNILTIKRSQNFVYDFTVLESHSFVGNGFINHNSTYLRQIALIVLMAHIGSFVPAKSAKIGLTDRTFTRIGAHDVLTENRSTFMVEMIESANILNNATDNSLVILDEIGRGTSTFDGVSIAWAIVEYLHNNIGKLGPRSLLATHYHELLELENLLPRVKNYHVTVKNVDGDIHFLYKVKEGGIDESYGIHVASLAGIPNKVIERANEILVELQEQMNQLEKTEDNGELTKKGLSEAIKKGKRQTQVTLLGNTALYTVDSTKEERKANDIYIENEKKLLKDLAKLDVNKITPIEAINILDQLSRKSKKIVKKK